MTLSVLVADLKGNISGHTIYTPCVTVIASIIAELWREGWGEGWGLSIPPLSTLAQEDVNKPGLHIG